MKRLCLLLLCIVSMASAFVAPAMAQVQSGTVSGTVQDQQGGLLPGATITLTGSDRTLTFVTAEDGRYRFLNVPPGTYKLTAELSGFTSLVRDNVLVVVGANVDLPFAMRVATVQETVTVEGTSPIVDSRATGTATNFTQDELSKVPTSRDPWALLRTVPGVQMDRVNIAGNETGQQSNFASKGASRYDTVWTMDGVVITDMSANGGSPTYFDFDAFDEIQISTSGHDIRQATGGAGLNFVVKRGTNQYRGTARGYFTNDGLEASNVPDELVALGVTPETADHNDQISDYGFDLGGPIVRDKAWVWGSWTKQDIRLIRSAGALTDRTILKTYNIKGNWQATSKDMISVLWFLGDKVKYGRATGDAQVLASTATWNQANRYPENRPHGLLKFENNHVFSSNLFLSSKYAYYGTGFSLEPQGGLEGQASVSTRLGQAFGTTRAQRFIRPQNILNFDANYYQSGWGGNHDIKFGVGWRRHDATSQQIWPGNMIQAQDFSDRRFARIYRNGNGTNRTEYLSFYVGDTFSKGRLTFDAGLRFDRQSGKALPSATLANREFPTLVPGIEFAGYDAPFTWNTLHPRLGMTYALDDSRKTLLRANFSRYAGQLDASTVGFANLSGNAGFVDYPWEDLNGDLFVQGNEVRLDLPVHCTGRRLQPGQPDVGRVGRHDRSGSRGADDDRLRVRTRARSDAEPRGCGQLHVQQVERVRRPHRCGRSARPHVHSLARSDRRGLHADRHAHGHAARRLGLQRADLRTELRADRRERQRARAHQLRRLSHDVQRHRAVGHQADVQPLDDARWLRVEQPARALRCRRPQPARQPDALRELLARRRRHRRAAQRRQRRR